MSNLIEVKVPDIGDFKDVEVIEVLVKVGDTIAAEQSLITVESDKASMEIPSSTAGVVKEVIVKLGDKVNEGVVLLRVESAGAAAAAPVAAPASSANSAPAPAAPVTAPAAPAAVSTAAASGPIQVAVPDIGDFDAVEVIEILVKVGDTVAAEQSLITVESDKASMEIPSSAAGVVKEIKVKLGDKVSQGTPLLVLEGAAAVAPAAPAAPAPAQAMAAVPTAPAAVAPASAPAKAVPAVATQANFDPHDNSNITKPHASPSVRKFARELGVDLSKVTGSGPKARILHDDVQAYVKGAVAAFVNGGSANKAAASGSGDGGDGAALGLLPWPKVDFAKFGPVTTAPLSRIKKISGANLHRNWVMIPHVTNHDDCDITDLEAFRVQWNKENEKSGVKLTMLAFMIKAAVAALKKFPEFNASLDGDNLVLKQYYHIGFAADTPNGLVVPVIKDADQKGVAQIAQEMGELAKKARDGKLGPAEMTGGTFTISSLGGIGGRYFTPIINAPEVSIMGVCKSSTQPTWNGKEFVPRLILPLSLSWDHRVIDGAAAARFNAYFGAIMADFRRVMI